jgi:glycosyltransferase involved in cell wall biosynthesis
LIHYSNQPQFKIFFNDVNLGLTKNLNIGLQYCVGDFIARLDADDICRPNRLELQVAYMLHHTNCMVLATLIQQIDETGQRMGSWALDKDTITQKSIEKVLPKENCIAHPSVLIRRGLFDKLRYNEAQKHSQDWDLWLQAVGYNLPIAKMDEVLLDYRVHHTSVTATSLKQSAYQKKHHFYKNFFAAHQSLPNKNFTARIKLAYYKNYLLLALSKVKRYLLPK